MGLTKLCLKNPAAVGVVLALIALSWRRLDHQAADPASAEHRAPGDRHLDRLARGVAARG